MLNNFHLTDSATGLHWVFGYGSLIYKVDFPYRQREIASIDGWARRFWQGSHDHRGTPAAPGRVLTLTRTPGQSCRGAAYLVEAEVFDHLDVREKNGYNRRDVEIFLLSTRTKVRGTTYFADRNNPAYLGAADPGEIAAQIARSRGPSGSNLEYLLHLAEALREIDAEDPHVFEIEAVLLQRHI